MDGGQTSPTVFAGNLCLPWLTKPLESFVWSCSVFQSLVPGCRAFKNPEAESFKARPALRTCSNKPGFSHVRTQVATACSSCHKIEMCLRTNAKTSMAARSPRRGQKESIFQDVEPVQTDHRSVDWDSQHVVASSVMCNWSCPAITTLQQAALSSVAKENRMAVLDSKQKNADSSNLQEWLLRLGSAPSSSKSNENRKCVVVVGLLFRSFIQLAEILNRSTWTKVTGQCGLLSV